MTKRLYETLMAELLECIELMNDTIDFSQMDTEAIQTANKICEILSDTRFSVFYHVKLDVFVEGKEFNVYRVDQRKGTSEILLDCYLDIDYEK